MRGNFNSSVRTSILTQVRNQIIATATPRGVIIAVGLYLVSLAALTVADLPLEREAPGITKPDLTFGYSYADISAILTAYGVIGRQAYLTNLAVDSIMPVMLAAATLLVVARAAPRGLGYLGIAPLVFMALDLIENIAFAVMVVQFPEVSPALVGFTRPVTMIKLSAFAITLPTLIIGGLYLTAAWLSRQIKARIGVS